MDNSKEFGRLKSITDGAGKLVGSATGKVKSLAANAQQSVIEVVDQNGNGEIDIEDIIIIGMKTPGIRVDRSQFLRKEFVKKYPQDVLEHMVAHTPMYAGISLTEIDKVADEVIKFERICVSGISTALGAPGGVAMAATIPADITQYYGYMLRTAQKLLYLYGFPEIGTREEGQPLDTETMNILIVCLGVMYGVAGANNALKAMAKALAAGVEKKLMKTALTKGTIYPVVKSVAKWFNVKMTKEIFAGFFKKSIPVVGGVVGGGITFVSFKPCCDRLKNALREAQLCDPDAQDESSLTVNQIEG